MKSVAAEGAGVDVGVAGNRRVASGVRTSWGVGVAGTAGLGVSIGVSCTAGGVVFSARVASGVRPDGAGVGVATEVHAVNAVNRRNADIYRLRFTLGIDLTAVC